MMEHPIDHLVLAGHDLDTLAAFYRRLGFLVGGRNRHPWGTENHIVQLEGCFLELIGLADDFRLLDLGDAAAPFANAVAAFLDHREGLALVALQSSDAVRDAARFAAGGIGLGKTLYFSRTAEAPDGTRREVAFTTAFAVDPARSAPDFFVCQHHRPENFWNPAMRLHPNGARRVLGAVMVADAPGRHADVMAKIFGPDNVEGYPSGLVVLAGGDRIDIVTPSAFRSEFGVADAGPNASFSACRIGVESMERMRRRLDAEAIPHAMEGSRLVVSSSAARGITLSFEPLT